MPASRVGHRPAIGRRRNPPPQTAASEALNVTRSWWRQSGLSDPDDKRVKRVVCNSKLVLREQASLSSKRLGEAARGSEVLVVDDEIVVDEEAGCVVVRCKIAQDSTPRGVALHPLGWVTAAKEGDLKLSPVSERRVTSGGSPAADLPRAEEASASAFASPTGHEGSEQQRIGHVELPWSLKLRTQLEKVHVDPSFSRLTLPLSPPSGGDSMASRIARRRQELARERHEKRSTPRKVEGPSTPEPSPDTPPDTPPGTSSGASGKKRPSKDETKFEWLSSAELAALAEAKRKTAKDKEQNARAMHDTVEAQLGRLLLEKKIKLDELMKEWDRNHDVSARPLANARGLLPPGRLPAAVWFEGL